MAGSTSRFAEASKSELDGVVAFAARQTLLSSRKSDMTLDRHYGLNFFTVRIGTPYEWTSINKVYNGKWYEQLRGIFAEDDQNAPDAFLIYERVKD